jgi:DHA1 family multidrug resistance protein-like MFS transporter
MWRRNLLVTWIAQVISLAGFGFAIPFLPFFIQELGVTDPDEVRLWTGILSSAPALAMAFMAPVWGMLADRLGRKLMILRAMVFGSIILALYSVAQSVLMVASLRIVQGLFTGTVTAAATLIAAGTPKEKLGTALGLLSSSTFIGFSLGPMIGGIVSEVFGFRASFLIGSLLLAVGAVLVIVLVEDKSPRTAAAKARAADSDAPRQATTRETLRGLLTFATVSSLGMLVLLRFTRALPVPFLPLYVQEARGGLEGAASTTGIISAGRGLVTAVAAVLLPRLGNRRPRILVILGLVTAAALFTLPLAFVPTLGLFSAFLIAGTFFLGGVEPLLQADLSLRTAPERRGLLFGVQTLVGNMGWFFAPLLGSAVSIAYGIKAVFLALPVFLFIAALIAGMLWRREYKTRR